MTRRRRLALFASIVVVTSVGGGCTDALLRLGVTGCAPKLVPTRALATELDLHARVRMQVAGREAAFDAVAQRRGGDLSLVGLVPAGPRLFAVRQRGTELDFVDTPRGAGRALGVRVLDALHRGVWSRDAEPAPSRREAAEVVIEYRRATRAAEPSGYAIRNPGCRYEATIVLLDHTLP